MISQFCPTLSKDLLKREFLNTAAAFAVLAVLGFAAGMLFPDAAQQLLDRFAAQLEQLGLSSNVPQSQMMATLFFNNVTASLLAMLYGLIPFVPLSALALGTNALLLGACHITSFKSAGVMYASTSAATSSSGATKDRKTRLQSSTRRRKDTSLLLRSFSVPAAGQRERFAWRKQLRQSRPSRI